jgi:hypothetical protein
MTKRQHRKLHNINIEAWTKPAEYKDLEQEQLKVDSRRLTKAF